MSGSLQRWSLLRSNKKSSSRGAGILPGLIVAAAIWGGGCAHYEPQPLHPAETAAQFEARSLEAPAFQRFWEQNHGPQAWPVKTWDLEALTLAAFYYHPSLEVARADWQLAQGGDKTAAARPNPTLSVVPGYAVNAAQGVSPWFPQLTFDVPLETAGKRGYRQAQAKHLTEAARLNLQDAAWQVRAHLRAALLEATAARQRAQALGAQQELQAQLLARQEQQRQAGALAEADLTLSRIAGNKLALDLADARQQAAEGQARVAEAVGVPLAALAGHELVWDFAVRPAAAAALLAPDLRRQALVGRADLLASLEAYAASQSAVQLEIAKQYPDIHLGPGYQYDQGDHKISLSLTAELPVLNQNQGPIAEAVARRAGAAAKFVALQAKVFSEMELAVTGLRAAGENLASLEALAAAQRQRAESVAAQRAAGAASAYDALNAQLELAAGDQLQLAARVKWHQACGALEDALRRPISWLAPAMLETAPRPAAAKEVKP